MADLNVKLKSKKKKKEIKVFISSTFKDMQGERDVLIRKVFPRLQRNFEEGGFKIIPLDLRWGIAETSDQLVLRCLSAVDECRPFFIGLIGSRYGNTSELTQAKIESSQGTSQRLRNWLKKNAGMRSITEYEAMYGALSTDIKSNAGARAGFFIRSPAFLEGIHKDVLPVFVDEDDASRERQEEFRRAVVYSKYHVFEDYPCVFDKEAYIDSGQIKVTELEQLEESMYDFLSKEIQEEIDQNHLQDDVKDENEHFRFASLSASTFSGRAEYLADFKMKMILTRYTLLSGPAGSGKTAFMSKLVQEYDSIGSRVIPFFPMVSEMPTMRNLLLYLRDMLTKTDETGIETGGSGRDGGADEGDGINMKSSETSTLIITVKAMLKSLKVPTYIFIDAINQVEYEESEMSNQLDFLDIANQNPNLFLVASSISGDSCYEKAVQMGLVVLEIRPFSKLDSRNLVQSTLKRYSKELDGKQMELILKKEDIDKPLYIVTLCEELRVYGDFDSLTAYIKKFPGEVKQALKHVIQRLETDHGTEVVSQTLCLIYCSQAVSMEDITVILSINSREKSWMQFHLDLEPYLQKKLHAEFFHQQLFFAVGDYYDLDEFSENGRFHKMLANHFFNIVKPEMAGNWLLSSGTRVDYFSLMTQLVWARQFAQAFEIFSDITFIEKCAKKELGYELVQQCDILKRTIGEMVAPHIFIEAVDFLKKNIHILEANPSQCFTKATQLKKSSSIHIEAMNKRAIGIYAEPYLEYLNIPEEDSVNVQTMLGHDLPVTHMAIHTDYFATCGKDRKVTVWNRGTGRANQVLELPNRRTPMAAAFSSSGTLYFGGIDGKVAMYDLTRKEIMREARVSTGNINAIEYFKKKDEILVGTSYGDFQVFYAPVLARMKSKRFTTGGVNSIRLSKDAKYVAISCGKFVYLSSEEPDFMQVQTEHQHPFLVTNAIFGGSNDSVIFSSLDRTVTVARWDRSNRALVPLHVLEGHLDIVLCLDISPDKSTLVSSGKDNLLKFWDINAGSLLGEIAGPSGTVYDVRYLEKNRVITVSYDRKLSIWNTEGVMAKSGGDGGGTGGHLMRILCADFSPSDTLLATGSRDRTVRVWDSRAYHLRAVLRGHTNSVLSCKFHPKQNLLATGGRDCKIMIWNTAHSFPLVKVLEGHEERVNSIDFSPSDSSGDSSSFLVSGGDDKLVILWKNFVLSKKLYGHRGPVTEVSFTPDGAKIASCSGDGTVKLWSSDSGTKLATFRGDGEYLSSLAISPMHPWIAAGSKLGIVYFFNIEDGRNIAALKCHRLNITSMKVSRNGLCLLTCSTDSSVNIIELDDELHLKMDVKAKNASLLRRIKREGLKLPPKPRIRVAATFVSDGRLTCLARMNVGNTIAVGEGSGKLFVLQPNGIDIV